MPNTKSVAIGIEIVKAFAMPDELQIAAGLTKLEGNFIDHYVSGNGNGALAAKQAGYKDPAKAAWLLLRRPHVQSAIRVKRMAAINGEGVAIAWETIKRLMTDDETPRHVQFQAARYTMEIAGYGVKADKAGGEKPLSEMTTAELEQFVTDKKKQLDALPMAVAKVIDLEDDSDDAASLAAETEPEPA